jgi:phenylpyruvate tautomerase PptA (4-oxalocrotonate tautomerase family)
MPHLRIRALSDSAMKDLSLSLPQELAKILNTPEDNFTIEKIATTFYHQGQAVLEADPMIEFLWFERGVEVRDAAAQKVTELVRAHKKSEFITVVFVDLPKESYYENGVKF